MIFQDMIRRRKIYKKKFSDAPELLFTVKIWFTLKHNYIFARHCRDRVSSRNIYAVQQDTQSLLMSEFIHHVC